MKKVAMGDEFVFDFRIMPQECGTQIMYNATALSLFELARLDMMIRSGIFKKAMKEKLYCPLASIAVTYHRPVKRLQKVSIRSTVTGHDDKWVYFRHDMVSKDKVYVSAVGKGVFKKGRETIPPEALMAEMGVSTLKFASEQDRELTRRLKPL